MGKLLNLLNPYKDVAKAINDEAWKLRDYPAWSGPMISSLSIAVGFAKSSGLMFVSETLEQYKYRITLFTGSMIVIGEAEDVLADDTKWSVTAFGLNEIESVKVSNTLGPFITALGPAIWPGDLTVRIQHSQIGEIVLEGKYATNEALLRLVPELMKNVGARV